MSANALKITLSTALDAAGIEATKEQVASLSKSVKDSMASASDHCGLKWTEFKSKFDLIVSGIKTGWDALTAGLKSAFRFETMETQFSRLTGSIDTAREHMRDLKELGDTPPFSLEEFAAASRAMMRMSDGALGYRESLVMVGDAAAATGIPLEAVGQAVGRLYGIIRDGQPLSRATMQLRNMGLMAPSVCAELQELQDQGADNNVIWERASRELSR